MRGTHITRIVTSGADTKSDAGSKTHDSAAREAGSSDYLDLAANADGLAHARFITGS